MSVGCLSIHSTVETCWKQSPTSSFSKGTNLTYYFRNFHRSTNLTSYFLKFCKSTYFKCYFCSFQSWKIHWTEWRGSTKLTSCSPGWGYSSRWVWRWWSGSELQSQGLRGQETSPSQGLLGLDSPVTPLKVELETYFKLPNLPTSNVDILAWWKTQEPVLPLLGEIARKYLCVTASSASAERLFSASGNVVTKLRSSLAL